MCVRMCLTWAGKSTLLNTLTAAGVLAEDKLFATLDPTTRKVGPQTRSRAAVSLAWLRCLRHLQRGCSSVGFTPYKPVSGDLHSAQNYTLPPASALCPWHSAQAACVFSLPLEHKAPCGGATQTSDCIPST